MSTYKRLSFTNEEERHLIDFVQEHPALWDAHCIEYGNVSLRTYYWKSISHELQKSVTECRRKWRFIRDYYVLKRKRVPNAPHSKYANLKFLDSIIARAKITKRNMSSEDKGETYEYNSADDPLEEADSHEDVGSTTVIKENECPEVFDADNNEIEILYDDEKILPAESFEDEMLVPEDLPTPDPKYIIIKAKTEEEPSKYVETKIKISAEEQRSELEQDTGIIQKKAIDLFFESMAATVKTFPPQLVAKAKMRVFNVINELETQLHQ